MKSNYLLLMAIASMCVSLVGCNEKKAKTDHKLWFAYSTENLLSDKDYFDGGENNEIYANRGKTLHFSCIKNENEGAQLMITASDYIASFDFELPDVSGPSGTIRKDHFSVAAAYYMNIDYSNEKSASSGFYPDALIPLFNYKFRRMNFIDKGRNQALYINLKTDENTPAGEYKGTGKLHLDDEVIDIPFEVKVYDVLLSEEVHQNSAFGLWYDQTVKGELSNYSPEMDEIYYNFLVDKRISPREMPPALTQSFDDFVESFTNLVAKNDRVASARIPIDIYNFSAANVESILQKMINKNLALRAAGDNKTNLFAKSFFYMDDEPYPDIFDRVREHDKTIFDVKKLLCSQLYSYPDLYESFTKIPNVVTREYLNELVATNTKGGVQTWCPLVSFFQSADNRALYRQRQASDDREFGEHVWWYTCCDPISPYPNYHLDASLMLARMMPYMEYDYDIEARLFWNTNYYSKYSRGDTLPRDIWTDPISWQLCAGDGMLMYPGYTFGINGPITTQRLENILAGNEEYEYLYMIEQKVEEYNALKGKHYVANELLNKYYSRLFTNVVANTDTANFETVRSELLNLLETLYTNLESGMEILLKQERSDEKEIAIIFIHPCSSYSFGLSKEQWFFRNRTR